MTTSGFEALESSRQTSSGHRTGFAGTTLRDEGFMVHMDRVRAALNAFT